MPEQTKEIQKQLWQWKNALMSFPRRLWLAATQPKRDRILRQLIEGKRVLIVGSGPSAKDMPDIPDDVLVFACNMSPAFLPLENGKRRVDLYMLSKNAYLDYTGRIEPLLHTLSVNVLATRDKDFVGKLVHHEDVVYERLAGRKDNYGFKRLTGEHISEEVVDSTARRSPSSGIGLLLYALIYRAQEVYIAGIDADTSGTEFSNRVQDSDTGSYSHEAVDNAVIRYVAENHANIFTAAEESPLEVIFPHKTLR